MLSTVMDRAAKTALGLLPILTFAKVFENKRLEPLGSSFPCIQCGNLGRALSGVGWEHRSRAHSSGHVYVGVRPEESMPIVLKSSDFPTSRSRIHQRRPSGLIFSHKSAPVRILGRISLRRTTRALVWGPRGRDNTCGAASYKSVAGGVDGYSPHYQLHEAIHQFQ